MAIQKYRTNQGLLNSGFNQSSGGTLTLSGNTILADTGTFQYLIDKSSTYVPRSVVDADYVTGLTSGIRSIGTTGEIIYRGVSGITGATGFTYSQATSGVTIPNLSISQTPETDTGDYFLLSWDSGTTKVNKVNAVSVTGLQGASNGLSVNGSDAILGGTLSDDILISGTGTTLSFNVTNDYINLENLSYGGIYLKSQSTTTPLFQTSFNNAVGFKVDYNDGFKVYDNRVGASQVGIEYATNYATFYTARSLVDKNYVDTIAAGLKPLPAVLAATTGNTILSGITGVTIIDGVVITVPVSLTDSRVLIKDQTDSRTNGIYILTGGTIGGTGTTFIRSYDFDESTESVQGAYTFVISGDTNKSTSWVLSTPNPILIDVTPLSFTLFNQLTTLIAGHGIDIDIDYGEHTISVDGTALAGNSIIWSGASGSGTFNVDITSGTLGTALTQIEYDITGNTAAIGVNTSNISNLSAISGITNTSITGVTNGLTKVGSHSAKLGGTLSEATTITATGITSLKFIDNRTTTTGIEYDDDYSTDFTNNSLVNKLYVDNSTSGGFITANNGLCSAGQIVSLGGTLTGDSVIEICTDTSLKFTDSRVGTLVTGLEYSGDYKQYFVDNSIVSKCYVDTAIGTLAITGATNGLSDCGSQQIGIGGTMGGLTHIGMCDAALFTICGTGDTGAYLNMGNNSTPQLDSLGFGYKNDAVTDCRSEMWFCNNAIVQLWSQSGATSLKAVCLDYSKALEYGDDYSADYTARSLVDVEYVTGFTSVGITSANNGLTKVGQNVVLGGTLTGNTTIDPNGLEFKVFNGSTVRFLVDDNKNTIEAKAGTVLIDGTTKLQTTPVTGAASDAVLVWNSADKIVKSVGQKGVTNGICVDGDNFVLGGDLTGHTVIESTGDYFSMSLASYGSITNNTCGSVILGGGSNTINQDFGTILGGYYNHICGAAGGGYDTISSIIGGNYNKLESGNTNSVLIGGTNITVAADALPNHAIVPSLAMFTTPSAGASGDVLLVWDSSDKKVKSVAQGSVGITTGANGVCVDGTNFVLGGALTGDTTIATTDFGVVFGKSSTAVGANAMVAGGNFNQGAGLDAFVGGGADNHACGGYSGIIGGTQTRIYTDGDNSGIVGGKQNQIYGAYSALIGGISNQVCSSNNAIIGGQSHIIETGNTNSVILGGASITVPADTYPSHAIVPNLAIWNTPATGSISDGVLVWNSTDKKVKTLDASNLSEDNNRYSLTAITSNITLTGSEYTVLADSTGGAFTITLPAAPVTEQAYKIKDSGLGALTNNITIAGNGKNIDGAATASINTDGGALELVYDGTAWFALSFVN